MSSPGSRGLRPADFERLLSSRPRARSKHFVLHHDASGITGPAAAKLSTDEPPLGPAPVEDRPRLGLVVPKRHARRAVTRTLIKRQGRAVFGAAASQLPSGDWLLRLRNPFPVSQFPSAASNALRSSVRQELRALFAGAGVARR